MEAPEGWVPAFPGQRPPFAPGNEWRAEVGNEKALRHGASSPRRVEPVANEIARRLRATDGLDYLTTTRFAGPLMDYARAEARSRLYAAWVDSLEMNEAMGVGHQGDPPFEILRQYEVRAQSLAVRIGLLPSVPDDVREQIEAARKTLARRAEAKQLQANLRQAIAQDWQQRRDGAR